MARGKRHSPEQIVNVLRRGAGYGDTLAIDGGQRKRFGQKLQVRITNWKPAEVAGIMIFVHGFAGKVGLLSTNDALADSPNSDKGDSLEAKKTFDVQMTVGANKQLSTNLWLNGFTAINLIDINSITYASGSTWHPSAQENCHFAPEGTTLTDEQLTNRRLTNGRPTHPELETANDFINHGLNWWRTPRWFAAPRKLPRLPANTVVIAYSTAERMRGASFHGR
jgi:hypothetical protein